VNLRTHYLHGKPGIRWLFMVMGCVAGKTTRTLIPTASLAISLDKDSGSVAEVRPLNCRDIDIRRSIRPRCSVVTATVA
jgi:hypothetical protein